MLNRKLAPVFSHDTFDEGVDAVVHMAALLHIVNPPPELR
jgi:hypothetical protein